jgi:methylphosphotriester-DNA--protein-cysteine methyltransferase
MEDSRSGYTAAEQRSSARFPWQPSWLFCPLHPLLEQPWASPKTSNSSPKSIPQLTERFVSPTGLRGGTAERVAAVRRRAIALSSIWGTKGTSLEDALAAAAPARRRELLTDAVASCEAVPDPLVLAAAAKLAASSMRVARVAAELGVSERQLHRRTLVAIGYGPKTLARVARLRRLVRLADQSLVTRALAAGYASQAHMNEEVRRLTGTTPVRFLKDAAMTAA